MNNVELLLLSIESNPDDLTAVACLTDALMEEQDMTRSEADRHAERVVESARDTRDLAAAAELLRPDQPWSCRLKLDIMHLVGFADIDAAAIVLIPGDTAPLHAEQREYQTNGWFTNHTITVGARWVTHHWYRTPSLSLTAPPKKKRRARPR